ncbi:hypothetical protein SUGI_0427240 [Cryptomeria japonica]|nr:hypothetical protein SUGI_0427240 [Cryptomeria japonica]
MGRMVAEEEQTRQWRTAQSSSSSKNVSNISGLRLYKGDLRSLKMLGTPRLRYLHLDIGKLSQLKQLSLSWCEKLGSLPESISNLSKLERLDMLRCHTAWKSIRYSILIQPKLCLLGLPPRVEEWRRGEQRERSLTKNQDQTEEWTTPKFRESMTEFRATLAPECQNLESKLTKIRNQLKRRPELKLPGKATKGNKHISIPFNGIE